MKLVYQKIKNITQHKYVFFTSNCTSAIFLLLKSLGFKKKKIIVPINICFDVIFSIIYSDNIPLIVDTNKNLGISFSDLKNKVIKNKNIGAIIFPYIYGNSDNVLSVQKFIKSKKILFIEDIACAFGGKIKKKYFGSLADYTVGSFGQGKIIDMSGGGFVSLNNQLVHAKIEKNYSLLKKHSLKSKNLYKKVNIIQNEIINSNKNKYFKKIKMKYFFDGFIYKKKFNNKYYSTLVKKINIIDKINKLRNKRALLYDKILNFKFFNPIVHTEGSVYWRKNFIIKRFDTKKLIEVFNKQSIYARKYYPPVNQIFGFLKKKIFNYEKSYKKLINFWVGDQVKKYHIIKVRKIFLNFNNVN